MDSVRNFSDPLGVEKHFSLISKGNLDEPDYSKTAMPMQNIYTI